jgi:hypothetical protein
MQARGLATDPAGTAEMNAQAEAGMNPPSMLDRVGQFGAGLVEGSAPLAGLPMDMLSAWGAGSLGQKGPDLPMGSAWMRQGADIAPPAADETDRRLRAAGEYIGPSAPFGPAGMASGALSGLAAGEVRERDGGAVAEIAAALLAGGGASAIAGKASKVAQTKRAIDAVPDIEDVQAAANVRYDAGRATGMTAPGALTQGLAEKVRGIATQESVITPSGKVADYPKIRHALDMVDEYAGLDMSPKQMQEVRKSLSAAAQSADGNEARVGTKMLKEFDKHIRNPLVPDFVEADKLHARAARGGEVKEAIDIARKGRRTAPDTAISNEFQNLVRKGIRGDMTYPPELEAAVAQAANGTTGRQIASGIGKAAPTGIVSGSLGFGVPASLVGNFAGGAAGLAAGGAASGVGSIAKLLADRMAKGDARSALATALNGAPLPTPQTPEAVRRALLAALLATSTAQQPR